MSSFGESLRRERELRGVSLQDIAAATKIGVTMLKAIEDDRLDKLPQGLFVRGFVREYARFLALDEQKVLTELSFHTAPLPSLEPAPQKEEEQNRFWSRLAPRLVNAGVVVGVFAGVAALILSPGWSSGSGSQPEPSTGQYAPSTAQTPSLEPRGSASNASLVSPDPALSDPETKPSVLPQPLQLTLTATEDCWIGLDVGGDRVEDRILKKGESFSISARQNASLAVGNAGGLLVAIDSGPARPLGNRGEVKRNIVLSPETLGALTAGSEGTPIKPIG